MATPDAVDTLFSLNSTGQSPTIEGCDGGAGGGGCAVRTSDERLLIEAIQPNESEELLITHVAVTDPSD